MTTPYKDMSPEQLIADNIKLRDQISTMSAKPTKEPFVFLNWHASIVFLFTFFGCIVLGSWLIQQSVNAEKFVPIYCVPAIALVPVVIVLFCAACGCFFEKPRKEFME
jgi:hypothetical protein